LSDGVASFDVAAARAAADGGVPHSIASVRQEAKESRGGRRWGDDVTLLDEAEARRRLLIAAESCIVRRGSARIRMGEVAEVAGVVRSTLYRYFPTRAELIVGLFLSKIDAALAAVVAGLSDPTSAAESLPALVLDPLGFIQGSPVNEALFSAESRDLVASWELGSEPLFDAVYLHYGPLLERWQSDGQLHPDVDLRDVVRWIETLQLALLHPPWRGRSRDDQRSVLEQFLVRALVAPAHW
jgi:TetR/AcrR family transcriptional regulator